MRGGLRNRPTRKDNEEQEINTRAVQRLAYTHCMLGTVAAITTSPNQRVRISRSLFISISVPSQFYLFSYLSLLLFLFLLFSFSLLLFLLLLLLVFFLVLFLLFLLLLTTGTETGTAHASCDFLIQLLVTLWCPVSVCSQCLVIEFCDRFHGSSKTIIRVSSIMVAERA